MVCLHYTLRFRSLHGGRRRGGRIVRIFSQVARGQRGASEVSNGEVESISPKSPFLPLYPTVGRQEKL